MMKNMFSVGSPWRTVVLVLVVAAVDVLLSVVSIGMGLDAGTVPDADESFSGFARFAFAPVLAPLGAVALVWRHRFPRAVAATTAVLAAVSLSGAAFLIALFLLARRRLDWWVGAVIALAVGMEALVGLQDVDWQYVTFAGLLMYGAVAAWGAYRGQLLRQRQAELAALKDQAERAESYRAADAERTRLAERHRIAREMHDTLAHRMSLVAIQAAAMQVDAPDAETAGSARLIRETAHAALGELREVLGVLREDGTAAQAATSVQPWEEVRPGSPDANVPAHPTSAHPTSAYAPSGLGEIAGLVAEWGRAGIDVAYQPLPESAVAIPDAVGRAAFRVVQEGLTNVARHAPEATAKVCLELRGGGAGPAELLIWVANSVANTVASPGGSVLGAGLGLVGLAERVQLLGGTLDSGPREGGFELVARIPVAHIPVEGLSA